MKKKEETRWQKVLLVIVMLIVSIPAIGVSAYLYEKSFRDIFILLMTVTVCFGMTIFSFFQSNIYHALHYDNGGHLSRFVLTFLMGTAGACLLPMLPDAGWILPVAALALTLFSNTVTGLTAYAGLMCVCAYFASADVLTFLLYFLTGVLFAVLFERLDNDYKTSAPMSIAVTIYVIEIAAGLIFQSHGTLTADELVIPIMNVFITFILMLATLRFYCAVVIDKEKGRYLRINDQEYELLAKYKEEDRQTYYNAIHTAYFAEKTARLLHMDVDVAKNGGYYHRIIVLECKKQERSLEEICQENKFPPEAVRLLQEYTYKSQPMRMRETVAVYFADCIVSSIMYLIEKEEAASQDRDFGKIATAIIRRKIGSGVLNNSEISLSDLSGIEKYIQEKNYTMTFYVESETDRALPFDAEEVAGKVIAETLECEKCPYEVSLNILLTDNDGIHELNRQHRGIDRPTDVLSFPNVDYDEPADFSAVEENIEDYFDPESGELCLGDIVISVDRVYGQAGEYGHSVRREYAFLVAHSMLHLLGYDHMEPAEAEVMERKQDEILDRLGITRSGQEAACQGER